MIKLYLGDYLKNIRCVPTGSIDFVLTDLPYGTTRCKWDSRVDLATMWLELNRVCKYSSAVALFGVEPFSSLLRLSNTQAYKYDWIWKKDKPTGFLNAKKQPLRQTETISVFYRKQCKYTPQYIEKTIENIRPADRGKRKNTDVYGALNKESKRGIPVTLGYPKNILEFSSNIENGDKGLHPTQKPVALLEYLIKTYTSENETVLDFTMGSGSTGVACINTNRKFIGFEKDNVYFDIAKQRLLNKNL